MTEAAAIEGTDRPVTQRSLVSDLRALGVEQGDVVIVHTSLSALGWVIGGSQAVVEALMESVGSAGTIVMPTQSGHVSDPAEWSAPPVPETWHQIVRDEMPTYDPALTPTRLMGQVVDCFRHHPSTVRSEHPQLSVAAAGRQADEIIRPHEFAAGLGPTSPLGRMYELGAKVLLLGVGHGNNTSLHLAEYQAEWPSKSTSQRGAPLIVNNERQWVEVEDLDIDEEDFEQIGASFVTEWKGEGAQTDGPVGAGIGRLMSMPALVDFATSWMSNNRR